MLAYRLYSPGAYPVLYFPALLWSTVFAYLCSLDTVVFRKIRMSDAYGCLLREHHVTKLSGALYVRVR